MSDIPETMKACVITEFGKTAIVDMPVPSIGPDDVLCRVRAVAICGSDPKVLRGEMRNLNWPPSLPFVLGHEWAGEVVAVGANVSDLKPGDRVASEGHCGCGQCENCKEGNYTICLNYGRRELGHRHYGFHDQGANAEYNVYRPKTLSKMPDNVDFAAATLCDTAGVALHGVELAGVTVSGTVVVIGPGPIGLCLVNIVKSMGADRIIMVGRGYRLQEAKEFGADILVDFEKEDAVARVRELTGGRGADEVFECSGAHSAPRMAVNCVRKGGAVVLLGMYKEEKVEPIPIQKLVNEQIRVIGSKANPNVSPKVLRMLAKGVIDWKRLITHRLPLDKYEEAVDIFVNRKENVLKVVIEP